MAQSTALRFRNRSRFDNVILSDVLGGSPQTISRILSDNVEFWDAAFTLAEKRIPGDRIASVVDSESWRPFRIHTSIDAASVNDAIVLEKTQHIILQEIIDNITDEGFITDKDLLRYRLIVDSLNVVDGFQKTVTRVSGAVVDKVLFDDVSVTDTSVVQVSGVIQRTLSDSIIIADLEVIKAEKIYSDSLDSTDSDVVLRTRIRLSADAIAITDDVIVTRGLILNTKTLSDSLTLYDRSSALVSDSLGLAAEIEHGIEAQ